MLIWTKENAMSLDLTPLTPQPQADLTRPKAVLPRARGTVGLSVGLRDGGTHLVRLRQSGCLKCILPRIFRADAEAVLVNTSGGVTGGDLIEVEGEVGPGACLTLTTQAAERIYRTRDGSMGRIGTRLSVEQDARLNWLPQETILFDGARLARDLRIELAPGARLLLCEMLVLGRGAMGEQVRDLHLEDRIIVTRAGAPVYRDGIRLTGDAQALMARAAVGGGARTLATLVFAAPQAGALLAQVRALLPETAGASLRSDGLMVLRALAPDSLSLRRSLIPVLELLSGLPLPAVWRL